MKIINYSKDNKQELDRIMLRSKKNDKELLQKVQGIITRVQEQKDQALIDLARQFDQCELVDLQVTAEEIAYAYTQVSKEFIRSLKQIIINQTRFQKSLLVRKSKPVETEKGIKVWREWRPIEKIGLYVPGGRANYPSSVVMVGVPALLAGCKEVIVCTPAKKDGTINPFVLVACNEVGVGKIFKTGGAQAVAAMAYGTETIPKVYKIFGAGNSYVTAAKILVQSEVAIDMPAGPSEVMVIADESANPEWVAADLISQCEHGPDSAAVLLTDSPALASEVERQVYSQAESLATKETILASLANYSAIILVQDLNEAVDIANEYAPEHLELCVKDYMNLKNKIVNAGSVFLGNFASEPAGDYATGGNHVLPTNGYARMYQALSVDAFGRQVEFQVLTKPGLSKIKKAVNVLGLAEGLPAHVNAVNVRFNKLLKLK